MTAWHIGRTFRDATRDDFTEAAAGFKEDLESVSGQSFTLKVIFYKAAQKTPLDPNKRPSREEWLKFHKDAYHLHQTGDLKTISKRIWNNADYVEVSYVQAQDEIGAEKKIVGTLQAKGWDGREIKFKVTPMATGFTVMRKFTDARFIFWNKGLDTFGMKNYPPG